MNYELNDKERQIADKVANEILIREKKQRLFLWLFLLLFIVLFSFFSSLVFSKIAYYGKSNQNYIQSGSVLFAYEEGTNFINISGALPVQDEVGKTMNKPNEYFEFSLSIVPSSDKQTSITYEISLLQLQNTLDSKYVRVYLLEDGKEVNINNNVVNTFYSLPNSTIRSNSKLLYKTTINSQISKTYIFKMWLDKDYELKYEPESFSCYVNIDAY